jgi:hypothetical protein
MWKPRSLISLRPFTACYRKSCTFIWLPKFLCVQSHYWNPFWSPIRKFIIFSPRLLPLLLMCVLLLLLLLLLLYSFINSCHYLYWTCLCAPRYPLWPMSTSVAAASSLPRCGVACHSSSSYVESTNRKEFESSCQMWVIFYRFYPKSEFVNKVYYNLQISIFIKISTGVLNLFHKGRRTAGKNLVGTPQVFAKE